ncbi:MAG: membrane protein insertase YidC [Oscillospiraceae bacterium]|nr:membrane protein insertase YidC [Oscillospiraceae bacterium]
MGIFDFIARPFAQFLMFLYNHTGSYGVALLIFAVAVKVVLLPFQMKAKRGTMKQARLSPKLQELQKKHSTNKQKINEEMQKLYREEGINPASGCIWGILPLPILFALFQAIRHPITMMMQVPEYLIAQGGEIYNRIYETGFVSTVGEFNIELDWAQHIARHWEYFTQWYEQGLRAIQFEMGGVLNLGQQPNWQFFWYEGTIWSGSEANWVGGLLLFLLPLVSGAAQFVSAGIMRKTQPAPAMPAGAAEGAGKQMQTMMMLMPLMSVFFGFTLPAALSFYWTIGTVLQIFQDLWLNKKYTKILDAEDAERNRIRAIKEAEIEAKRIETERKKAEGLVEKNPNKSKRKKQIEEKQERLEKTVQWQRKNAPPSETEEVYEPSRVGKRRYARGRAYEPDRYPDAVPMSGEGESEIDEEAVEATLLASGAVDEYGNVITPDEAHDLDEAVDSSDSYGSEDHADGGEEHYEDSDESVDGDIPELPEMPEVNKTEDADTTVRFETTRFEEDKKD